MEIFFIIAILVFSIVIHEIAHGSMANSLGDPTARYAGRLTLNPLKHLDPVGSFIIPLLLIIMPTNFVFGWAKPVPVNPYNFTDQKYGQLKVALAGPMSNLLLALIFGLASRMIPLEASAREAIGEEFLFLGGEMIATGFWGQVFYLFLFITFINILLGIFNLIPIPPLDGSHILFTFFPSLEEKAREIYAKAGFIGLAILFFLLITLFPFILKPILAVFRMVVGV